MMNDKNKFREMRFFWSLTKFFLKIVALWPVSRNRTKFQKRLDQIHFFVISSSVFFYFIAMATMCYIHYVDFVSAAESIGPMVK